MNPRRGDSIKSPTLSLAKTTAVAMIIASVMLFVAMFYPLYKNVSTVKGEDLLSYYLPWCLSYGIPALGFATYAVIMLVNVASHPTWMKGLSILAMVCGGVIFAGGFPIGIALKGTEFMVSILVIGVCVAVIGFLTLRSYKEEF